MKIPNPYFENILDVGDFTLEYIIFSSTYPILFTCKDREENLYIVCCCCNSYEQRWLVSEISIEELGLLITDKLTIAEAFENTERRKYLLRWSKGDKEISATIPIDNKFDDLDIPDRGEFLEIEEDEFSDYIRILSLEKILRSLRKELLPEKKEQYINMAKVYYRKIEEIKKEDF